MPMRHRSSMAHPCRIAPCPTVTWSPTTVGYDGSCLTCTMTPSCRFVCAADPDVVHVAADDRVHPDAALRTDDHVADHLGGLVDVRRWVDRSGIGGCDSDRSIADVGRTLRSAPQIFGSVTPRCAWYLPALVLVGHLARLVALEEQHLRDALVGVDLRRQRRRVRDLDRDVPFPLGLERRHVHDDAAARVGRFAQADREHVARDAEVLHGARQRERVRRDRAHVRPDVDERLAGRTPSGSTTVL